VAAHPWRAAGLWVVVLGLALALGSVAVGAKYSSSNGIPGTESQRAIDLLARDFPSQAGDSDQIVFHFRSGSVRSPAVRARVVPMLARVARLPHVSNVVSPYTAAGADAVSQDGRTAFATVNFDKNRDAVPVGAIKGVIDTAQSIRSPTLQVGLGGEAIKNAQGISLSFATTVGVAAALVVLLLTFGSLLAAGMPIVTALFGLGTTFGLIALASRVIKMPDASTELAAMIGLGVGIDYALFILTRFRESVHRGNSVHVAVVEAMDTAGRAVLLAGLTVIVALLGMLALGVGFLSGLAVASALGPGDDAGVVDAASGAARRARRADRSPPIPAPAHDDRVGRCPLAACIAVGAVGRAGPPPAVARRDRRDSDHARDRNPGAVDPPRARRRRQRPPGRDDAHCI
jgi:RND superfamily putative drug exporter